MTPHTAVDDQSDQCTLASAMADARRRLVAAGVEAADREARWLIEHALGLTGSSHLVDSARPLDEREMAKVECLCHPEGRQGNRSNTFWEPRNFAGSNSTSIPPC